MDGEQQGSTRRLRSQEWFQNSDNVSITGFSRASYSVSSSVASRATPTLGTTGVTTSAASATHWLVEGRIVNRGTVTRTGVAAIVWAMNARGSILDVLVRSTTSTTLTTGASSPFSATFTTFPTPPGGTGLKGRAT